MSSESFKAGNFFIDIMAPRAEIASMSLHPLTAYRRLHGLTLSAIAERIGVQKAAVWKWENGRSPNPALAREIERVTDGDVSKEQLRPDLWPPDEKK